MLPHDLLLMTLVNHYLESETFNWRAVSVTLPDYENEIARQENMTDELAEKQGIYNRSRLEEFHNLFDDQRPTFDGLYSGETSTRPSTFPEFVGRFQDIGGEFWGIGASLYENMTKNRPNEQVIREFIERCPPFQAKLLAIFLALYGRCVRDAKSGPSLKAGKFDIYMSVYLPYCDQFITADQQQLDALREVASVSTLGVRVRSYRDFKDGLLGRPTAGF
jgi:hypothetical protein